MSKSRCFQVKCYAYVFRIFLLHVFEQYIEETIYSICIKSVFCLQQTSSLKSVKSPVQYAVAVYHHNPAAVHIITTNLSILVYCTQKNNNRKRLFVISSLH